MTRREINVQKEEEKSNVREDASGEPGDPCGDGQWGAGYCYMDWELISVTWLEILRDGTQGEQWEMEQCEERRWSRPSPTDHHPFRIHTNGWQGMVRKVGEIPREKHVPGTERAGSFMEKRVSTVSIPETGQVQRDLAIRSRSVNWGCWRAKRGKGNKNRPCKEDAWKRGEQNKVAFSVGYGFEEGFKIQKTWASYRQ